MTREEMSELKAAVARLMHDNNKDSGDFNMLVDFIDETYSTLCPITREQVEKVWKPCEICGEERALYQSTRNTKLYVATFGKRKMLETESNACPPYSNCSRKNIPVCAGFEIEYCPKCGRPLTAEAMQMVMERLDALNKQTTP